MSALHSSTDVTVPPTVYVRPASLPLSAQAAVTERHDAVCVDLQRGAWPTEFVPEAMAQCSDPVLTVWIRSFGIWVPVRIFRADPWRYLHPIRYMRAVGLVIPPELRDPTHQY
ncbi:hypothetical protein [Nocardiopsis sp. YSL2]|uniref:hypothetical protein n=1 Tax=Nocardiopsis sp. YSL2 TaxID=2939492 RepID=UPI0026F44DE9|nr:hypothetical protein [Nocardiopsis sp. YSL2]